MYRRLSSNLGKMTSMVAVAMLLLTGCGPQYKVLDPAGPVGQTEKGLIILSVVLTAIVVVPVLALLAFIVVRYRDKPNNKAPYTPEWSESRTLEIIWWGIPIVIVAILGGFTAQATFELQRPPVQNVQPITVQVTSLDWKWLFQYPGQKVATVNYCEVPTGVPVQFELTADAPMNSFWVPQLGGQEYTMPGTAMQLWLQADKPGEYAGYGANFTGKGFAHMNFTVNAVSTDDFNKWVDQTKSSSPALTMAGYEDLKKPSISNKLSFSSYPPGLFKQVVSEDGGKYNMQNMGSVAGQNP